jgi:hypothetical protein
MNLNAFLALYPAAQKPKPKPKLAPKPAPKRKSKPRSKLEWVVYFAQRFPSREQTQLEALSERALALLEEPEVFQSLSTREQITGFTGGVTPEELDEPQHQALRQRVLREFDGDDLDDLYPWRPWELLEIFSARDVPGLDPSTPLSEADRSDIAEAIFTRAAESAYDWHGLQEEVFEQTVPRAVLLQETLREKAGLSPLARQQARLAVGPDPFDTRIRVIDKATALERVRAWHKELADPNYRGFFVGVGFMAGGQLRGVGIATSPSGGASKGDDKEQHHILEASRIATDDAQGRGSVKGASSAIMRWFMRNADRLVRPGATEPAKVITFSLLTEVGTTYSALIGEGLHAVGLTIPKPPSGARRGGAGGRKETPKIRWEYGELARKHQPHLLQLFRAYNAVVRDGGPLEARHFRYLDTPEALRDLARVLGFSIREFAKASTVAERKAILLARYGKQGREIERIVKSAVRAGRKRSAGTVDEGRNPPVVYAVEVALVSKKRVEGMVEDGWIRWFKYGDEIVVWRRTP